MCQQLQSRVALSAQLSESWPRRADLVEIVPSAADSDVGQQCSNADVGACKHWQLTALAASVISSVITRLCKGIPRGGDPTVTWPTAHRQQDRIGGGAELKTDES